MRDLVEAMRGLPLWLRIVIGAIPLLAYTALVVTVFVMQIPHGVNLLFAASFFILLLNLLVQRHLKKKPPVPEG
jgi:hypothetical protein